MGITERQVHNFTLALKEKRAFNIADISSVEMSTMADNFLVIHVRGQHSLCVICDQKTEAVNILRKQYAKMLGGKTQLNVSFTDRIAVAERKSMFHGPVHTLVFVPGDPASAGTTFQNNKTEKA